MSKRGVILGGLLAAGVVLTGVLGPAEAQVKKGKTRAAATSQIMGGVMQPTCAALAAGLKAEPADEAAWKKLATSAAVLNELSYTVMEDGRCPDANWAKAAKTLRDCSGVVLEKVKAKDHEGSAAAFKELTKACAACHKAHRKG